MVERLDHARIHWGYKCDDLEPLFEYITPAQWIIDLIPRGDNRDVGAAVITAKGELDGIDHSGENNPMWKGGVTYDMKEYDKKRQQTPQYKEYHKKYRESEQYKERSKAYHKKYRESEQYKEYQKKYKESEAGIASRKKYDSKRYGTPEFRAWSREYRAKNRDEMNRKQREYRDKNRDEMNRKQREYRARKKAETQGEGTLKAFLK